MRVIAKSTIEHYAKRPGRQGAAVALRDWHRLVSKSTWQTPNEVKRTLGTASIITSERVVFNIAGNKHRLIAAIDYQRQILFIKFIGTHAEYDQVDAATIEYKADP